MRITVDLISQAFQSLNPAHEYTLHLRGYKIANIENLGATQDYFECIDFSDNEIIKLTNFPPLKRLKTLIFANNRISRIDPEIFNSLPNLTSLILTNNKIERLEDLKPLFQCKKLTHLSLTDNPVTVSVVYRYFLIAHLNNLRILDFKRITLNEKEQATKFIKQHPELNQENNTASKNVQSTKMNKINENNSAEIEKLKMEISQATTLEETSKLEKLYNEKLLEKANNSNHVLPNYNASQDASYDSRNTEISQ